MERTKKRNDVDEDGFRTAADAYAENSDVFGATITSGTNHSAGHQVASTQINENEGFLETMEMRIMEEALRMGGIAFSSNEPYTSFVPSDKAISKFMARALQHLDAHLDEEGGNHQGDERVQDV